MVNLSHLSPYVLLLISVTGSSLDFFSSTVRNPQLVQVHEQMLKLIQQYVKAAEEAVESLNRYVHSVESGYVSQPWETEGDPLRSYHLVKRTSKELDDVVATIRKLRSLDPLLELENFREKGSLPTMIDYRGITRSLLRLQRMYLTFPEKMVKGHMTKGVELPVKLSAADCLFLGKTSEDQHVLGSSDVHKVEATLWYQAGLKLITDSPFDLELKDEIVNRLKHLHQEQITMFGQPHEYLDYLDSSFITDVLNYTQPDSDIQRIYRRLCRGEKIRAPSMDINTECYLKRGPHPYLRLRPVKVEVLNVDPYLVLLHDIMGEKEMKMLREAALPLIGRSTHLGYDAQTEQTDKRISVTAWIGDNAVPGFPQRLEAFTGLTANNTAMDAEEFQVLNYGIGGHYSTHYDFLSGAKTDQFFSASGDRMATLMVYLTDVEAGGATAFPYMGISIFPKKGAAAFWWDLRSDCEGDPLTTHGACPVIYGTKWVSNKWFRVYPQMFRVGCSLNQYSTLPHI